MKTITKFALASLAFVGLGATAAPVEYDTPDAHIVVIRPMDQWNPNRSLSESLDDNYFQDKYSGNYSIRPKDYFSLKGDTPFAVFFRSKYPKKSIGGGVYTIVSEPISINPADVTKFTNVQNTFYFASVISQGNPSTLSDRINSNQILRNVLTVATLGASAKFGGLSFAAALAGSTIPSDIGNLPLEAQQAIVGQKTVAMDYSKCKQIDVRKTYANGKTGPQGQIIIAYKADKTESAENEALAIAIGSTLGFDTTKEATMASRAADLADRQAIWDKCVADGKCKNEE